VKVYNFFCYDTYGTEQSIFIKALTEDAAWDEFEERYPDYYVDQVLLFGEIE
jgi:hypothetical protein